MSKGKSSTFALFLKSKLFAYILTAVQSIFTVILLGIVLYINMLPVKFFIPICFVLLVLCAVPFLMAHSKKAKTAGKIISVVMILIVTVGMYFASIASGTFERLLVLILRLTWLTYML